MLSDRLKGLAQHLRMQTQQHPTTQTVLAERLRNFATMAAAAGASSLSRSLTKTAAGIDRLAQADPWRPMSREDREELADFLETGAASAERAASRGAAGGAA